MNVADLLQKGAGTFVMTSRASDSVREAAHVLARNDIGALPICDSAGRVEGILSERDIVRALATHGGETLDMKVGELMTRDVVVCDARETLTAIMERMTGRRIRHLPVVEDGFLRGIISERDVVRGTLEQVRSRMAVLQEGAASSV